MNGRRSHEVDGRMGDALAASEVAAAARHMLGERENLLESYQLLASQRLARSAVNNQQLVVGVLEEFRDVDVRSKQLKTS